jgi:hypothetical protein
VQLDIVHARITVDHQSGQTLHIGAFTRVEISQGNEPAVALGHQCPAIRQELYGRRLRDIRQDALGDEVAVQAWEYMPGCRIVSPGLC